MSPRAAFVLAALVAASFFSSRSLVLAREPPSAFGSAFDARASTEARSNRDVDDAAPSTEKPRRGDGVVERARRGLHAIRGRLDAGLDRRDPHLDAADD